MTRERMHKLLDYLMDCEDISFLNPATGRTNSGGRLSMLGTSISKVVTRKGITVQTTTASLRMSDEDENLCDLLDAADAVSNAGANLVSVACSYLGERERTGYNS